MAGISGLPDLLKVIYHQIAPTRSTTIPLAHFSKLVATIVVLVCDRYSAYKKLARLNPAIILAFCWAHVRRDFLEAANGFPTVKEWALDWVEEIGTLYHLNSQRLAHWQEALPLAQQNELFQVEQKRLEHRIEQMKERCDMLLQADRVATSSPRPTGKKGKIIPGLRPGELHSEQRKVLASLQNHWHGLIIFVTHPEVPMDNNFAEQAIRHLCCRSKKLLRLRQHLECGIGRHDVLSVSDPGTLEYKHTPLAARIPDCLRQQWWRRTQRPYPFSAMVHE